MNREQFESEVKKLLGGHKYLIKREVDQLTTKIGKLFERAVRGEKKGRKIPTDDGPGN